MLLHAHTTKALNVWGHTQRSPLIIPAVVPLMSGVYWHTNSIAVNDNCTLTGATIYYKFCGKSRPNV